MKEKIRTKILNNKHIVSIEKLHHFRCGVCDKWWSIGDFNKTKVKELFCPWCGVKRNINLKVKNQKSKI